MMYGFRSKARLKSKPSLSRSPGASFESFTWDSRTALHDTLVRSTAILPSISETWSMADFLKRLRSNVRSCKVISDSQDSSAYGGLHWKI
ncbi:hypothetical protein ACLOJK_013461 [Asimina triloba]